MNETYLAAIDRTDHDRHVISDMLETSRWFSEAALRARSWCAVPVFEGIGPVAARGMAAAAVPATLAKAYTTENGVIEEQYQFLVSDVAFLEFERVLLLRHFLVISVPEQFAIVHEANYYWAIAASPEFIDAAFGMPPLRVIEEFERECENTCLPSRHGVGGRVIRRQRPVSGALYEGRVWKVSRRFVPRDARIPTRLAPRHAVCIASETGERSGRNSRGQSFVVRSAYRRTHRSAPS